MTEWREMALGEVCAAGDGFIRTGPFGSQLHQADYIEDPDGIPVVMPKDMNGGRIDRSSIARISDATASRLSAHLLKPGDVVLARRGDVGRCVWVSSADPPVLCGTGSMRIHLGRGGPIETTYLRYFMQSCSVADFLQGQAVGATMPNLNAEIVASVPVLVPPQGHQVRIADILGSIDDLIENNRRRIELLEQMAQAIYWEWFVRFRFPGHENAAFVDSVLGPIPNGWQIRPLGDVSTNFDRLRKPISKAQRREWRGPFPYYGAAKLIDWVDGWIFDGEYLLFAEDGSVQMPDGYPVRQLVEGRFWANNHTHILQGKDVSTRFLYMATSRVSISGYVTGAAQPKITQANLNRIPLLIAPRPIQDAFDAVTDPIFDEWRACQERTIPLAAIRGLLLPKLVSGEIDVSGLDL